MHTCRSPRRCAPAASSTAPRSRCGGWPPTTARPKAGAAAVLSDVHGVLIPGGFGIRGIEGKIGAIQLRPQAGLAGARSVPRVAVHRHRGGPLGRAHRGQLRGVRSEDTRSGDLHDGRPARRGRGRGRPRRHHAAGRLPGRTGAGFHCGAGIPDHRGVRAAPAPLRGQQRLPRPHRARAGCGSPARRPTGTWSSSSSTPPMSTRSSSEPRPTRS